MKTQVKYFIAVLLTTAMCSPAFAENSRRMEEAAGKNIKKSAVTIGHAGKEAGKSIGEYLRKIGIKTGKAFKEMAMAIRDRAQKDLK